ncbi:hypothetical protein [Streptosporangium sp. NPDC048865]|uniref:hypothetical protein n=1 Tax=Streptosporangium sp. NPDC048865 TaxID=3155766 RepID=UPI003432EB0A
MTLLVALLSLAAACGGAESDISATPADDGPPKPVASLGAEGGFVTATTNVLRPPRVVLYSDGLVVADASRQLKLTDAERDRTVASMERYLTGQPPTATPRPDAPMVTDVPATVLKVRGKDGKTLEVRALALDQVARFYPRELSEAKKLMDGLATRATDKGTDYVATRVRLVAEGAASATDRPAPWPAGVPEPSGTVDPVWRKDVEGATASAVTKAVPVWQGHSRALFRTGSGALFILSWRYLLPGE